MDNFVGSVVYQPVPKRAWSERRKETTKRNFYKSAKIIHDGAWSWGGGEREISQKEDPDRGPCMILAALW